MQAAREKVVKEFDSLNARIQKLTADLEDKIRRETKALADNAQLQVCFLNDVEDSSQLVSVGSP
jgi:hypothetical protein